MTRWKWNTPSVTSELFDDEVVLVNFDSGKYHSLRGSGLVLWQWLASGASADSLIARACATFEGSAPAIEAAVRTFLGELEREHLIALTTSDDSSNVPSTHTSHAVPSSHRCWRPSRTCRSCSSSIRFMR